MDKTFAEWLSTQQHPSQTVPLITALLRDVPHAVEDEAALVQFYRSLDSRRAGAFRSAWALFRVWAAASSGAVLAELPDSAAPSDGFRSWLQERVGLTTASLYLSRVACLLHTREVQTQDDLLAVLQAQPLSTQPLTLSGWNHYVEYQASMGVSLPRLPDSRVQGRRAVQDHPEDAFAAPLLRFLRYLHCDDWSYLRVPTRDWVRAKTGEILWLDEDGHAWPYGTQDCVAGLLLTGNQQKIAVGLPHAVLDDYMAWANPTNTFPSFLFCAHPGRPFDTTHAFNLAVSACAFGQVQPEDKGVTQEWGRRWKLWDRARRNLAPAVIAAQAPAVAKPTPTLAEATRMLAQAPGSKDPETLAQAALKDWLATSVNLLPKGMAPPSQEVMLEVFRRHFKVPLPPPAESQAEDIARAAGVTIPDAPQEEESDDAS